MDAQRRPRAEYDGTITVLADSFESKRLTGPNDVVVKSDGSIWLRDNGAGTRGNYLGHKAEWELPLRVYRLDPATSQMTIAVGDMRRPNGLAFSPDERLLYVVDTPGPGQRTVQVYDVVDDGATTANRREFCSAEPGGSDGIRVDVDGNIWCAWGGGEAEDGVAIYAPDGTMISRIMLPERCANVCFGGQKRNRLFIAATDATGTAGQGANPAPALKLNFLSHGTLESRDLAFSRRFYEEFLGLQIVQTSPISLLVRRGGANTIAVVYSKNVGEMNLLNHNGLDVCTKEEVDESHR